jgi:hypothetical protein
MDEKSGAALCRAVISNISANTHAERALAASTRQLEASHDRLQKAEKRLSVRNRIAEIFLETPDDKMYGEVLEVVLKVMQSRHGMLGYIDDQGDLVVPSMTDQVWDMCDVSSKKSVFFRNEWGDGSWARALETKKN